MARAVMPGKHKTSVYYSKILSRNKIKTWLSLSKFFFMQISPTAEQIRQKEIRATLNKSMKLIKHSSLIPLF